MEEEGDGVVEEEGEWIYGACGQSGTWIDISTYGSTEDLSMISRPRESFGRGSC